MKSWIRFFSLLFIAAILNNCKDIQSVKNGVTPSSKSIVSKSQHGLLSSPHLDANISLINRKDIQLEAEITDGILRSGRYMRQVLLPNNKLAIACVRGLDIFDINSEKLHLITSIDTPGHAYSVDYVDDYIWVADGYAGITIIDPRTFDIAFRWPEITSARSFCYTENGNIVICRHSHGASLLSPKSKSKPDILSNLDPPGRIFHACSAGDYVYFATMDEGYIGMDISNRQKPQIKWQYDKLKRGSWCQYFNGHHYILEQRTGLLVLKDHTDAPPNEIAKLSIPGKSRDAVFLDDKILLIAGSHFLTSVDVSIPFKPKLISQFKPGNEGRGISVADGAVYFSDGDKGVKSLTVKSDGNFKLQDSFNRERILSDIVIKDDYILATHSHAGVEICRLKPDGTIEWIRKIGGFRYASAIDIEDNIAAVADYFGLRILDVTEPQNAKIISKIKTPGRCVGVDICGKMAYVADWFEGLRIIDLSVPQNPRERSAIKLKGWAGEVVVDDSIAYACCVNGGIFVVDCRNPDKPLIVHEINDTDPEGIDLTKKALYVADFNFGLVIYDRTDPLHPKPKACHRQNVTKSIHIRENMLMLSNYIFGVKWFSIADPFDPVFIGELDTPGKCYEIAYIDDQNEAILADWHGLYRIRWVHSASANP